MAVRAASVSLHRLADALGEVPDAVVIAAARAVKDVARREGGSVRLWSRRRRRARTVRLRAVDNVRRTGPAQVTARVQGLPVGPWVWANTGTDAHLVGAGATKASRRTTAQRARRDVRILSGPRFAHPVRGPVVHPGARGRGAWRRVVARTERIVPDVAGDELARALRR